MLGKTIPANRQSKLFAGDPFILCAVGQD